MRKKPRVDIIQLLADEALKGMDGCGVDDFTPAEVVSAAFTMTSKICKTILAECDSSDLDHNIDEMQNAIATLFAILPNRTKH